jgi:hypothetical protein
MQRFAKSSALASAIRPQLRDGKWNKPKLSARYAARLRKEAIVSGTFGTFEEGVGGWDWRWDKKAAIKGMKAPKLSKSVRTRDDRMRAIEQNMAEMPAKIAEMRKQVRARKPPTGIEGLLRADKKFGE